jgi:hypothetical protein
MEIDCDEFEIDSSATNRAVGDVDFFDEDVKFKATAASSKRCTITIKGNFQQVNATAETVEHNGNGIVLKGWPIVKTGGKEISADTIEVKMEISSKGEISTTGEIITKPISN